MPDSNCPTCRGEGRIAPSAFFEEKEPWSVYLARIIGVHVTEGWQLCDVSADHCKMIRPVPCPTCSAHEGAPAGPSVVPAGATVVPTESSYLELTTPVQAVAGDELEPFTLGA